jgi:glycosyltransferase involved in cell wall biosynthesis
LTGGGDKPYALGLAEALTKAGLHLDFIGSDELAVSTILDNARIRFLNLRGDQSPKANSIAKFIRVLCYYVRLVRYAAGGTPRIFHLLWNNRFENFDRTFLLLYYRLLGKRILFTAHNVNVAQRDGKDCWMNRWTLRMQYQLLDHIFVHTDAMKTELCRDFVVPENKVSVIPFGINDTVPKTSLSRTEAKDRLGLKRSDKALLFFGNIAPYKGLEYLVAAFCEVTKESDDYRLIIAGRRKGSEDYWRQIERAISADGVKERLIRRIEYIPDEQTELYFKAADVLMLPYIHVFQSGVLFLGYNFGLPVIASDVGSLKDEVILGKTGFMVKPKDPAELVGAIRSYFASDLYRNLDRNQPTIRDYAHKRYSWARVAEITQSVYADLLNG